MIPEISIVIPIYNEAPSLSNLHNRLKNVLAKLQRPFEIILVDDGSTDETNTIVQSLSTITCLQLKRNFGQTIALAAGICEAKGSIIVTLDGDLENDPEDIPKLLAKLDEGFDIVSGWRRGRWSDQPFTRRFPSFLANKLISCLTGTKLHDHGCTLKAYRKSILERLSFSGDMHRMLAAYAAQLGAKVAEIPVNFTKRRYGKSHYGPSRIIKVLLDVMAFYFFRKYHNRPMHFFGIAGMWAFTLGCIAFFLMFYLKYFRQTSFIATPLPILTALFIIIGFQFILFGLLAEMNYRLLREQNRTGLYDIANKIHTT